MMGQQEIEERERLRADLQEEIEEHDRLRDKLRELGVLVQDYRDLGGCVRLRFNTGDPADFMDDLGTEEVTVDLIGIEVDD